MAGKKLLPEGGDVKLPKRAPAALPRMRTSLNPREFDYAPIDVAEKLRRCYEWYSGASDTSALSLMGFPDSLITAIDKIRRRAFFGSSRVGFSAAAACCLEHGVEVLDEHATITTIQRLKSRFDFMVNEDGDAEEVVASFFRTFSVVVSMPGANKRKNLHIPTSIKSRLSGLAEDLGVEISSFAVICMMVTISAQQCVNAQQRESFAKLVMAFLRRLELRVKGTEALMERLL
jgi:hypothetical protein